MAAPPTSQEIVQELEGYLSQAKLDGIIKQLVVHCLKDKPAEPVPHMLKHMISSNSGVCSLDVSVSSTDDGTVHVAVAAEEAEQQQYLNSVGADAIFRDLLQLVLAERPEGDLLDFIPQAVQKLKAKPG